MLSMATVRKKKKKSITAPADASNLQPAVLTKAETERGASDDPGQSPLAQCLGFKSQEVTAGCDCGLPGDCGYFSGAQCANERRALGGAGAEFQQLTVRCTHMLLYSVS